MSYFIDKFKFTFFSISKIKCFFSYCTSKVSGVDIFSTRNFLRMVIADIFYAYGYLDNFFSVLWKMCQLIDFMIRNMLSTLKYCTFLIVVKEKSFLIHVKCILFRKLIVTIVEINLNAHFFMIIFRTSTIQSYCFSQQWIWVTE